MKSNKKLAAIRNCSWFIVRFDKDGAILYSNKSNNKISKLVYDPKIGEEGIVREKISEKDTASDTEKKKKKSKNKKTKK